jgi:hypothetical protein
LINYYLRTRNIAVHDDAIYVTGRALIHVDPIGLIGGQAARGDEETFVVDRGQLVPGREAQKAKAEPHQ